MNNSTNPTNPTNSTNSTHKPKGHTFYEARMMGGHMVMLFEKHSSLDAAMAGFAANKADGKIRHCIVKIIRDKNQHATK